MNQKDVSIHLDLHHTALLIVCFIAYLHYQLEGIRIDVSNAVHDIKKALNGRYPLLARQLIDILGDSTSLQKATIAYTHIRRAKQVLNQGQSQDDLQSWLDSGKANGGVVR